MDEQGTILRTPSTKIGYFGIIRRKKNEDFRLK